MRVTLYHYDRDVRSLGRQLEPGRTLLFGQGGRADVKLTGEDVANVHFSIEYDGSTVTVRSLAVGMMPVLLNGKPVESATLNDGDVVAVGNSKVRIQCGDHPAAETTSKPSFAPAVTAPAGLIPRELPTGLIALEDLKRQMLVSDVIEQLLIRLQPLLVANFRASGADPPAWLPAERDLLAGFPLDDRDGDSLFLITPADILPEEFDAASPELLADQREKLVELFLQLCAKDCAVLLFSSTSSGDVAQAIGVYQGFFCSADGLATMLTDGPPKLAKALIASFDAVLFAHADTSEWTIIASPAAATSDTLGIPVRSG